MTSRHSIFFVLIFLIKMLAGAYTLGMLTLVAAWIMAPERTWWLALSNIFALYLFLPLVLLVLLALLLRSWSLGVMNMLLIVLFGLQFFGRLMPPTLYQSKSADNSSGSFDNNSLRVVTLNQMFLNRDTAGTLAVIMSQDADIIAIQELSTQMAQAIEQDATITVRYPYQLLEPKSNWKGMGILSLYPFVEGERPTTLHVQNVVLNVRGQQVRLINAHPASPLLRLQGLGTLPLISQLPQLNRLQLVRGYNPGRRDMYLGQLIKMIDASDGPLLVVGDFNTSDREIMYRLFASRMTDVYRVAGSGLGNTFPNGHLRGASTIPFPVLRIDYIWTRGITPLNSRVVCDAAGSDHCMVVAEVKLEQA